MSVENKMIIALVSDDFEDLELWYPVLRLREAGAVVHLVGEKKDTVYHGKYGVPVTSDYSFEEITKEEYDGILVPGGWSPDKLRRFPKVIEFVQYFDQQKKPIGQICHAGWVLISAGILNGVNVTSTPGIKDDMTNAGAIWHDTPAITDGHIVSSRRPPDLPEYMKQYIASFD
ncbi:MAG: type 1 glutamine amidotransferase domain-containing protein [Carnobacterium sp.]|uniref:type 1 glutamine amidotransferase domain-containing protein n=1 Tax=Carnobacterium sp. TaxID=48221 RepID=UPI0033159147